MLQAEGLRVGYGEGWVLRDVGLEVPPGRIVCLMGRNGAGKTTLLKTLVGLLRPSRGHVRVDGQEVTAWPSDRRARAGIAYVPQGRGIFPHLTVWENLLLGLEAARGGDRRTDLEAAIDTFPALRAHLRRPAGGLSGGQQQQLAIARALASRPAWLLLDEPTEGVQPSIVDEIESVLAAIRAQGRTGILLVEQYLAFALRLGDRYVLMERGAVVGQGDVKGLDRSHVEEVLAL